MTMHFSNSARSDKDNEQGDRTQSNYSTERSPGTELLRAGKEAVILPIIQPETPPEGERRAECSVQE